MIDRRIEDKEGGSAKWEEQDSGANQESYHVEGSSR